MLLFPVSSVATCQLPPLALYSILYPDIAAPPLEGAVQDKSALSVPAVGVRPVGAPGAVLTEIAPLAPDRASPASPPYSIT